MPELRWILLVLGLGVVIGIYLWGRRRSASQEKTTAAPRVEPHLAGEEGWPPPAERPAEEPVDMPQSRPPQEGPATAPRQEQRILALHVRSPEGEHMSGPDLERAFAAEGLEFGQYDAFHLLAASGQPVFTIVSMIEPGTFPAGRMEDFSTPGLTMFMMLSTTDGVESLSKMVACARRLASRLGADVLDQDGSTFSNQRAAHMREEIVEYLRQARLGSGQTD